MPIASRPDHVAIAVPSIDAALPRWQDELGGVVQWRFHTPTVFRGAALRFHGGAYLEMLMPSDAAERTRTAGGPSGFVEGFLDRFGPRVHHVTLKVPDLPAALRVLEDGGFTPRDVHMDDPGWREAFLRPSQVGGLIVQVASSDMSGEDFGRANGWTPPGPPDSGAVLLGPQLVHDDLDRATVVWELLGGTVDRDRDGLLVWWPDEPLTIAVREGDAPGTLGLRFAAAPAAGDDDTLGPAVLPVPAADAAS